MLSCPPLPLPLQRAAWVSRRGRCAELQGGWWKAGTEKWEAPFQQALGVTLEGAVVTGLQPPSPASLQQKEQETSKLKQEVEMLQAQKRELLTPPSRGENSVAGLKDKLWKLESSALEQQQIRSQQENTIQQLEQVGKLSLADSEAQGCY